MEFWSSFAAGPSRAATIARAAEADGWTGITTVDSQNLSGDPYVFLALAGGATEKLGVMTSVTNPVTRHPAVTATSALTVNSVTRGRMVCGIGRGDSALAYLGRAPARLTWFEQYLKNLQAYLGGEEVAFSATGIPDDVAPPVDTLGLADTPTASSIHWAGNRAKVPVEVAATGAKVIGIAARHADRIMFALGAAPDRIAWGIDTARQAAEAAGRDPDSLRYGAYVNLVCLKDMAAARELARGGTSLFARFSAMHGKVNGPADDRQSEVLRDVHSKYDMNKHAQSGGDQAAALTDDFLDYYAILGGKEYCIERLQALAELGVDKFAVTGPNATRQEGVAGEAASMLCGEVFPALSR